MSRGLLCCLLLSLLVLPLSADLKISNSDLCRHGIVPLNLKTAILSADADFYIAFEYLQDIQRRRRGQVWALRIFRFNAQHNKLERVDTVYLPLTELRGAALTDNDKALIIVGNYGTKILKVDLRTLKLSTVFAHTKNQPGFKTQYLANSYYGRVFLIGYFYDKDQYYQSDYLVELRPNRPGLAKFQKHLEFQTFLKGFQGRIRQWSIISNNLGYFAVEHLYKKRQPRYLGRGWTELVLYQDGKRTRLDKGLSFGWIAGGYTKICYLIVRPGKVFQIHGQRFIRNELKCYIKDIKSDKTWEISRLPNQKYPFSYPFLAKYNGATVLLSINDMRKARMNIYYGKEAENYKLRPLLLNVTPGALKLAFNGQYYLFQNQEGLTLGSLK